VEELAARYDRCPGCLTPWGEIVPPAHGGPVITADHIVAIANGGPNTIENIQPLCYRCNSRKGTGSLVVLGREDRGIGLAW
jgi:5-methylcytosine-specific restriction endonuclease McrA